LYKPVYACLYKVVVKLKVTYLFCSEGKENDSGW